MFYLFSKLVLGFFVIGAGIPVFLFFYCGWYKKCFEYTFDFLIGYGYCLAWVCSLIFLIYALITS